MGPLFGDLAKAGFSSICSSAEHQFNCMRKLVARQAAPVTLKSAFLEPLSSDMPTQLALDLFAMTDSEFMQMFTGGCDLCVCRGVDHE